MKVRNNQKRGNARAFTLVELLVVVSIIALLISILLPSLRKARDSAKMTKCLAHMRGMGQAAMVFAADHNDRFQLTATEDGINYADPDKNRYAYGGDGEILSWPVAIAQGAGMNFSNNWDWGVRAQERSIAMRKQRRMNRNLEIVKCPADKVEVSSPWYPQETSLKGTGDPEDPVSGGNDVRYWGFLSYGINEDITGVDLDTEPPACWRTVNNGTQWVECLGEHRAHPASPCGKAPNYGRRLRGQLEKVNRAADVGFIFETGPDKRDSNDEWQANLVFSATPSATTKDMDAAGPYLSNFQRTQAQRMPRERHLDRKVNVCYADGHGGSAKPVEFDPDTDLPLKYAPRVRVSPYSITGYSGD